MALEIASLAPNDPALAGPLAGSLAIIIIIICFP